MDIVYSTHFERNVKKLPVHLLPSYSKEILLLIDKIKIANNLDEIENCKKIVGFDGSFYRIKILKEYRIGLQIIDNSVWFMCFLHRKDIYKSFP